MNAILLNADTDLAVVIHGATQPWVPSSLPGIERKRLERAGGEVALATRIVRYAPESRFVFDGTAHAPGVDLAPELVPAPPGAGETILTSTAGALLWRKRGHLSRSEG